MSLPRLHTSQVFQARFQILQEQMDPVLKMLFSLTKAEQTFLSFWNEDYNAVFNQVGIFHHDENFEGDQLRNKFQSLYSDVIYIQNARLHTLVQDIPFFSDPDHCSNVFLLPLLDSNENRVGVLGLNMPSNDNFDFVIHQIEIVGQHLLSIYNNLLARDIRSSNNKVNFDDMPASFLNFCLSKDAELLECHFSKYLLRNHPALQNYSGNSPEFLESVLQMKLKGLTEMLLKSDNEQNIEYVYPYVVSGQQKRYFLIRIYASPSGESDFNCLAYITDISIHHNYNAVLDQILFDISHVMRRPVVSMKGLTNLIDLNEFDRNDFYKIAEKIKVVSDEMEDYIRAMFKIYEAKQESEYRL